uniref:Atypical chemokine receptor 2 n=1 Tax=Bos taurus TaxID=9913 RepID=Q58D77_BOVIN|nr:chemokine binding protein 2 [Bos taurus]
MATTASPLPPTTKVASSENSSSFYDYEYYLEDMIFMLCRKDEVLSFGRVFLPVFYSLIFVLGLVGNLLLLAVLLRFVPRRRMTETYLLNLAISNLLFVVTLPFWGISVAWHWVFGSVLCKVVSTLYTVNFYSGIFFISCMSLDKYLEIVCARPYHRLRTRAKSLLLAASVWAMALAVSIPDMVFVRTHENSPGVWECYADFGGHGTIWKLFLRFQQNLLGFLLPLLAMIFFYSRIGSVLVSLRPPGQRRGPEDGRSSGGGLLCAVVPVQSHLVPALAAGPASLWGLQGQPAPGLCAAGDGEHRLPALLLHPRPLRLLQPPLPPVPQGFPGHCAQKATGPAVKLF